MFYNDQKKLSDQQWLNSIFKQMNLNEFMDMDMPKTLTPNPPAIVHKAQKTTENKKAMAAYKNFFHTFCNQNPQILFYIPDVRKKSETFEIYDKFKNDLKKIGITWSSVFNDQIDDLETFRMGFQLYNKLPEYIKQNIIIYNSEEPFSYSPEAIDAQRSIRQHLTSEIKDAEKISIKESYNLYDW